MASKKKKVELKIVVVDDSEYSRKSIVEILEKNNFNVVGQAGHAEEAVQISATQTGPVMPPTVQLVTVQQAMVIWTSW